MKDESGAHCGLRRGKEEKGNSLENTSDLDGMRNGNRDRERERERKRI